MKYNIDKRVNSIINEEILTGSNLGEKKRFDVYIDFLYQKGNEINKDMKVCECWELTNWEIKLKQWM